jgi:hypothetical protein
MQWTGMPFVVDEALKPVMQWPSALGIETGHAVALGIEIGHAVALWLSVERANRLLLFLIVF